MNLDYTAFNKILNEPYVVLSDRDPIFKEVLDSFNNKPLNIFQVGAIETFNSAWAYGSGWSDVIFSKHLKKYAGSLTIIDIDLDHIANSLFLSNVLQYQDLLSVIHGNACDKETVNWDVCGQPYDIYYLDGGNDPMETYFQYQKIQQKNCVILVDDFYIKGTMLKDENFTIHRVANGFGVKDCRK